MAYLGWFIIGHVIFRYVNASLGMWYFILTVYGWACIVSGSSECGSGGGGSSSPRSSCGLYDRLYEDGSHRTENLSGSGYHYSSNGSESWLGLLGEEHREDGTVVYENAFIPGQRDIMMTVLELPADFNPSQKSI